MRELTGVFVPVPTPYKGDAFATDRLNALAMQSRWEEAKEIAARMMRADRGMVGRYGIGGLKAALDLQGFYGGPCRAPLPTPDGDGIEDIKESLASAGLL